MVFWSDTCSPCLFRSIVCLEFLFGHDTACGNLVSFTDFFFVLLSCIPGPQIEYHDLRYTEWI